MKAIRQTITRNTAEKMLKFQEKMKPKNMVLPSYEVELNSDNSIVSEPKPILKYHQLLEKLRKVYTSETVQFLYKFLGFKTENKLVKSVETFVWNPFSVKKIAIIGIHGWFPGSFLRKVVGEPVGTSTKFIEMSKLATCQFFKQRFGIELDSEQISMIPLEGEGKISERVDLLYAQLSDPLRSWLNDIKDADLVFVAAHSQGTPVSVMLVSKLIENMHLNLTRQRVGILTMAGISHGPFPDLKSSLIVKYVETDPARELFDFNYSNTAISQRYYGCLNYILNAGVRLAVVGSWYDQVVPLYSAILQGFNHPNIYRGLYIDAVDYQPDFLSHLIVFVLNLRNYGLHDYGLIVALSDVIQGNIYGFGTQGHYALYEELNTYILGIAWTMGRRTFWKKDEDELVFPDFDAPTKINPYFIPWILAKLQSDTKIASHPKLSKDFDDLLQLFKTWDAQTKAAKELKYRLEPLRSKL